jgi:hypothetical protein
VAGITNPPGFGGARYGATHWARYHAFAGPPFSVADSTDWLPTVNTGIARTINVAAGRGQACGVYEDTDATETVAFAANSGAGTRLDYLVATFDWAAKTRVFRALTGSVGAYPAINGSLTVVNPAQVNRVPGVQYDAIIAAVQVPVGRGIFQPGDLVSDMRPWGGAAGPMVSFATSATRSAIHIPIGAQLQVSGMEVQQRQPSGLLLSTRPKLMVVGSGTQSVAKDAYPAVLLSTVATATGIDYVTGTGRATVTEAGYYRPGGGVSWLHGQNFDGWRIAGIAKNGTPLEHTFGQTYPTAGNSVWSSIASGPLVSIEPGDYITLIANHLSDDPTTLTLNRTRSFLSLTYEGS